jgi:hypothetical protein
MGISSPLVRSNLLRRPAQGRDAGAVRLSPRHSVSCATPFFFAHFGQVSAGFGGARIWHRPSLRTAEPLGASDIAPLPPRSAPARMRAGRHAFAVAASRESAVRQCRVPIRRNRQQQRQEQRPSHSLTSCVGSRVDCGGGFPPPPKVKARAIGSQAPRADGVACCVA